MEDVNLDEHVVMSMTGTSCRTSIPVVLCAAAPNTWQRTVMQSKLAKVDRL